MIPNLPNLIVLVGLPGSGKSTYAEELAKKENAIIVSSDAIREELFNGFRGKRQNQAIVFGTLFRRVEKLLSEGNNVIIDSTNIDREKRYKIIRKLYKYPKDCYYINTPYNVSLQHVFERKNSLSEKRMKRYYIHTNVPMLREGWDNLYFIHHGEQDLISHKEEFEKVVKSECNYEDLFKYLNQFEIFKDIYQFDQDSAYHKYPVCLHSYYVYKYINENYVGNDKFLMQLVALLHDIGKPFCQEYKPNRDYASYYGHENVSAQLAAHFLYRLGYDSDFIKKVVELVGLHMHLLIATKDPSFESEAYRLIGDDIWKLYILREADNLAKGI